MGLLTKLKSLLGFEEDRSEVRRGDSGVTIEREPDESPEPDSEVESAVKGVDTGTAPSAEAEVSDEQTESAADATEPDTETETTEADATPGDATTTGDTTEADSTTGDATEADSGAEATEADTEADATETDTTAADVSTEDVTTAPEGAEDVPTEREDAAEPAEAAGPSTDAAEPEQTAGDEPEPTPEDTSDESVPEADEAAGEPVGEGEPLEDVKGIGPAYAERLQDAGVSDIAELAKADADQLAEETGLSSKRISTWIERAQAR